MRKAIKKSNRVLEITAVVLLVGVFALSGIARADLSLKDKIAAYAGEVLGNKLAEEIDLGGDELSFGATPGGNFELGEITLSGAKFYGDSGSFANTATGTPCSILTPNATTSPITLAFNLKESSGTTKIGIAVNQTNTYATSSVVESKVLTAGQTDFLVATNTAIALGGELSPNTRVNFFLENNTAATGTCSMLLGY